MSNQRSDPWGKPVSQPTEWLTNVRPYVGLMAIYTLSAGDAAAINAQRVTDLGHANAARVGDEYPFLICKVWSENPAPEHSVNGQVFIDGDFSWWATSRSQGAAHEESRWCVRGAPYAYA